MAYNHIESYTKKREKIKSKIFTMTLVQSQPNDKNQQS